MFFLKMQVFLKKFLLLKKISKIKVSLDYREKDKIFLFKMNINYGF